MDLQAALNQEQQTLVKLEQTMRAQLAAGKLTDYYLAQWYYQRVLDYVLHQFENDKSALLPKSWPVMQQLFKGRSGFVDIIKVGQSSKLLQSSGTYLQMYTSIRRLLMNATISHQVKEFKDGWQISMKVK